MCPFTYHAYLDESNTHSGAPIICAAGYIFAPEGADDFGRHWQSFLEQRGLEEFHANVIQYRPDASELFAALTKLIGETAEAGFVRLLTRESLQAIQRQPAAQRLTGSAYSMCILTCMETMAEYAKQKGWQLSYFVEDGNEYAGELRHFLRAIKGNSELRESFAMLDANTVAPWEGSKVSPAFSSWQEWLHGIEGTARHVPHFFSCFSDVSATFQGAINAIHGMMSNCTKF